MSTSAGVPELFEGEKKIKINDCIVDFHQLLRLMWFVTVILDVPLLIPTKSRLLEMHLVYNTMLILELKVQLVLHIITHAYTLSWSHIFVHTSN